MNETPSPSLDQTCIDINCAFLGRAVDYGTRIADEKTDNKATLILECRTGTPSRFLKRPRREIIGTHKPRKSIVIFTQPHTSANGEAFKYAQPFTCPKTK